MKDSSWFVFKEIVVPMASFEGFAAAANEKDCRIRPLRRQWAVAGFLASIRIQGRQETRVFR
jgi:hypothetical protein